MEFCIVDAKALWPNGMLSVNTCRRLLGEVFHICIAGLSVLVTALEFMLTLAMQ